MPYLVIRLGDSSISLLASWRSENLLASLSRPDNVVNNEDRLGKAKAMVNMLPPLLSIFENRISEKITLKTTLCLEMPMST